MNQVSILKREHPTFGISLPHFGAIGPTTIADSARLAERAGFDALWVRDHLAFPSNREGNADGVFIDPFVSLATCAAVTNRISFGFAALIPHRHPINSAALLSSLDYLAGADRMVVGIGLGGRRSEVEIATDVSWDRRKAIVEYIRVMRAIWAGDDDFEGEYYKTQGFRVRPVPSSPIPVSYCGNNDPGVQRAAQWCDAWGPSKAPVAEFTRRVDQVALACEALAKPPLPMLAAALVAVGSTYSDARELPEIRDYVRMVERKYGAELAARPDLGGLLIAGDADEIAAQVDSYVAAGATHFAFDLRMNLKDWTKCVEILATDVLPKLQGR